MSLPDPVEDTDESLTLPGLPAPTQPARPSTPSPDRAAGALRRDADRRAGNAASREEKQARENYKPPIPAGFRQDMNDRREGDNRAREANRVRTPEENDAASAGVVDRARRQIGSEREGEKARQAGRDNRRRNAALKTDEAAQAKYDNDMRIWQTQYDNAVELGNQPLIARLERSRPTAPRPSLESTGGLTMEEIEEPVEATLQRLPADQQEALRRMHGDPAVDENGKPIVGEDTNDSMNMAFADLPPAERLQAMSASAQNYMQTNEAFPTSPAFTGTRGGFGNPRRGDVFLPPNNTQPRDSYRNTPRSPNESVSGAPRARPQNVDPFTGGMGPTAAGSPDLLAYALPAGFNIDGPRDQQWRSRVQAAAQELGVDMNAFDQSPRGEAMFWKEAERAVRAHLERTGGITDPVTGEKRNTVRDKDGNLVPRQQVVGSGDPNNPYRYSQTDAARRSDGIRQMQKDAADFVGRHPIPDSLKDVRVKDPTDETGERTLNLHEALQQAADRGDKESYVAIRQKIINAERGGQQAMLVQQRKLRAMQVQMNSPTMGQASFATAMQEAAGDPEAQATILRQYGMFDEADRMDMRGIERGEVDHRRRMDESAAESAAVTAGAAATKAGGDPPPTDRDLALTDKADAFVRDVVSGNGGGLYGAANDAFGPKGAGLTQDEIRGRVLRSAKKHGMPISHPELDKFIEDEWRNGKYTWITGQEFPEQFISNLSRISGYSADEVRQWARSNPEKLTDWSGAQRPVDPPTQAPAVAPEMAVGGP